MKKKLYIVSLIILQTGVDLSAQDLELTPFPPGNTKVVRISVTNGIASTFNWSETDPLNIISGVTGNADSITITASPLATDGQTASVSVEAVSNTGSCLSAPKTLNIIIKEQTTLNATFASAPATACFGTDALFLIGFTGDSIDSYKYFIDLDGNGILNGKEVEITRKPTKLTSDSLTLSFPDSGKYAVIIRSVTGYSGGRLITSSLNVSHSIYVYPKPEIAGNNLDIQSICVKATSLYSRYDTLGIKYHWRLTGGGVLSSDTTDTVTVKWGRIPGKYRLSVYGTKDGCASNTQQVDVTLNAEPVIIFNAYRNMCIGDTFKYDVGSDYISVLWQDGSTSRYYSSDTAKFIKVTVTNVNGCTASDTLTIKWHPLPLLELGKDTMLCGNLGLELVAGNNSLAKYNWAVFDKGLFHEFNTSSIKVGPGYKRIWATITD